MLAGRGWVAGNWAKKHWVSIKWQNKTGVFIYSEGLDDKNMTFCIMAVVAYMNVCLCVQIHAQWTQGSYDLKFFFVFFSVPHIGDIKTVNFSRFLNHSQHVIWYYSPRTSNPLRFHSIESSHRPSIVNAIHVWYKCSKLMCFMQNVRHGPSVD